MPRYAMVGCSHIHAPNFCKRLADRSDAEVACLWDAAPEPAKARSADFEQHGVSVPVAGELDAVLADKGVDAVVICSTTAEHRGLVDRAVSAGKHVFVEKPLGMDAADARAIGDRVAGSGLIFQAGFFMRSQPAYRWLHDRLSAGDFGRVHRIRLSNCHQGALGGWFDSQWRWMADPARAGCGGFGDLGAHVVDLLTWWLAATGDRPASVTAMIAPGSGRYADSGCDELGEGVIRTAGGTLAGISAGWTDSVNPLRALVCGSEGAAYLVGDRLTARGAKLVDGEGEQPVTDLPEALPHAFDLFLEAVAGGGTEDLVPLEQAVAGNELIDAFYRSAAQGSVVNLGG